MLRPEWCSPGKSVTAKYGNKTSGEYLYLGSTFHPNKELRFKLLYGKHGEVYVPPKLVPKPPEETVEETTLDVTEIETVGELLDTLESIPSEPVVE